MLSKGEATMLFWLNDNRMRPYAYYKSSYCKSLQGKGMIKVLFAQETNEYFVRITEAGLAAARSSERA